MLRMFVVSGLLILALGCKHPQAPDSTVSASPNQCPIIGRIILGPTIRAPSASFCRDRIVGPTVNLARQTDGSWAGWISGQSVWLAVSDGQLESPTLHLNIEDTGQGTEVHGSWFNQFIQIRVSPSEVFVRTPSLRIPLWVRRAPDGSYGEGRYAQAVRFEGEAAEVHPPEPQFALAMLGAF